MESLKSTDVKNAKGQDRIESQSKWRILKQSISLLSTQDNHLNGRSSLWKVLKEAMLKRKGLIEIGPQHANYEFTRKISKLNLLNYKRNLLLAR